MTAIDARPVRKAKELGNLFFLFLFLVSPFSVTDAQDFWQQTNGPEGGGLVSALITDSNGHVYAGTNNGIFRSTNSGENWVQVTSGLKNVSIYSFAMNSSAHIFAGTFNGVFRSIDNGNTWTLFSDGFPTAYVNALTINSSGHIFAGTNRGLLISINNGQNWTPINSGLTDLGVVALALNSSGHVFAGTFSGVFRSVDSGKTWTKNSNDMSNSGVETLAINSIGHIFAGTDKGVFQSLNNGENWTKLDVGPDSITVGALTIDAKGFILAGTSAGVFRSTNSGEHWQRLSSNGLTNTDIRDLVVDVNEILFLGTRFGVFRSADDGENWIQTNAGLIISNVFSMAINSGGHIFASTYEGVFRSTDDGRSWIRPSKAATGYLAINSTGHIFAGTFGGVFRSEDNGDTWELFDSGFAMVSVRALVVNSDGHIFAATSDGVFRSTDNGENWMPINNGLTRTNVYSLAINSEGLVFAGTDGGITGIIAVIFRSADNGNTWTQVKSTGIVPNSVRAFAHNSFGGIYAGERNIVFYSSDNGETWGGLNDGFPSSIHALILDSNGDIFAGTDNSGVFRSTNNGITWTEVNAGLANTSISSFAINSDGYVYLGTFGAGIFRSIQSTITSVFTPIGASLEGIAGAAVWGDYDNDDDLDLLLAGLSGVIGMITRVNLKIYRNDRGNFVSIATSLPAVYSASAAWGDYDNDGDLDILLSGHTGSERLSKVYRNDHGNFFDSSANLFADSWTTWGDYDNDGDLDIFLTGLDSVAGSFIKIYRNDGGNFFELPPSLKELTFGPGCLGDYDNDGDLDILVINTKDANSISQIYRNDSGNFVETASTLNGLIYNSAAWGDYDNDGDLDILVMGTKDAKKVSQIYRNDSGNFVEIAAVLAEGVWRANAVWGDYDNDGDLDILLTGDGPVSKIYRNDGGTFFEIPDQLEQLAFGSGAWGDYDNDGDLDILLTGDPLRGIDGGTTSILYRNNAGAVNTAPAIPANLTAFVSGTAAKLSWDKSSDDQTPSNALTYNLRIGTTRNGIQIVSPMANSTTGYRSIPQLGNASQGNTWTVKNLVSGRYYWSVQAIDHSFIGSGFAQEESFVVDTISPQIAHTPIALANTGEVQSISAVINDNIGIKSVTLFYRMGGMRTYVSTQMPKVSNDQYEGTIPADFVNEYGVEYYFIAQDSIGNYETYPKTNPEVRPQVIQVANSNLAFPNPIPEKAYRMISVPADLNDKSPASVLQDDLGLYDNTLWRLLHYINGGNVEFGSPTFNNFEPGKGFWLIALESKSLDAGGGKSVNTMENYTITLPPGWSQIGNPFAFTVNWSDVVKGNNVEDRLVGYQGALNEASGYDYTRTQLLPWEGYFVNNLGDTPAAIEIPPKAAMGAFPKSGANLLKDTNFQDHEWAVQITATTDHFVDKDNYVGCFKNAFDAWDPEDFSEAPFFDQYVSLYFPHSEWKTFAGLYTGDFRSITADGHDWNFRVQTNLLTATTVTLSLIDGHNLPSEWTMLLIDRQNHLSVNFIAENKYSFRSGKGLSIREFQILAGTKDFIGANSSDFVDLPKHFRLTQNYPNPFNPITVIRYELPAKGRVTLRVYDLLGNVVTTLENDEKRDPGIYEKVVDLRSFASGIYFYRISVTGEKRVQATKKMVLAK